MTIRKSLYQGTQINTSATLFFIFYVNLSSILQKALWAEPEARTAKKLDAKLDFNGILKAHIYCNYFN